MHFGGNMYVNLIIIAIHSINILKSNIYRYIYIYLEQKELSTLATAFVLIDLIDLILWGIKSYFIKLLSKNFEAALFHNSQHENDPYIQRYDIKKLCKYI